MKAVNRSLQGTKSDALSFSRDGCVGERHEEADGLVWQIESRVIRDVALLRLLVHCSQSALAGRCARL